MRRRLLEEANIPPGPGVANVWMRENPCMFFSDHNTATGTRTWEQPQGDGTNFEEVRGNLFAELARDCIEALRRLGKEWSFENQARRRIYLQV